MVIAIPLVFMTPPALLRNLKIHYTFSIDLLKLRVEIISYDMMQLSI